MEVEWDEGKGVHRCTKCGHVVPLWALVTPPVMGGICNTPGAFAMPHTASAFFPCARPEKVHIGIIGVVRDVAGLVHGVRAAGWERPRGPCFTGAND